MAGCGGDHSSTDGLITVDVTIVIQPKKSWSFKTSWMWSIFRWKQTMSLLIKDMIQAVGEKYIIVANYNNDGNIFVYDRSGKAIRKINRKGQGGEEYINFRCVTLDEENNEIFINDHYKKRIKVYDLEGNFKRSLKQKTEGDSQFYWEIFNYDKENLICYDEINAEIPSCSYRSRTGA